MSKTRSTSTPAGEPPAAATAESAARAPRQSLFAQVEKLAAMQLGNRYLWLICAGGLYLMGQLSWWQAKFMRFDTLLLLNHISGVLHLTLFLAAIVLALATPTTAAAWLARHPGTRFNYVACGLSAPLVLTPVLLLLLVPMMILHRYPELIAQAGIHAPLMLLQRGMLLLCLAVFAYNVVLALRHNLRWPWALCGGLATAGYLWFCYYITWLSYGNEFFRRLNDLTYFNQLWRYFPTFPNLQRPEVFHNMQQMFLPYLASLILLCAFTALLWLPRASQLSSGPQRDSD